MRNFFLVLLLANLGFAAWYWWFAEAASLATVAPSLENSNVTLLSELAPGQRRLFSEGSAAENFSEAQSSVGPSPISCVTIGPYSELAQLEQFTELLQSQGYSPEVRTEDGDVWLGYWVYLPNVTTSGQAETLRTALAEQGITDTFFDPFNEDGEVLSLGLFRELARAEAVRDQALNAGYEPEMEDRTTPGAVYWANFTQQDSEESGLEYPQDASGSVRMEAIDCRTAAKLSIGKDYSFLKWASLTGPTRNRLGA
jgi:hypothetical protein